MASSRKMMQKPIVRVTQIEAFRRYMAQSERGYEIEEPTFDGFTGNEYTRIGTAFHTIVEKGDPPYMAIPAGDRHFLYYGKDKTESVPRGFLYDVDNYYVVMDDAQRMVALDYRNEHPQAFHEVRTYKEYDEAVVTGCADMIDGVEIRDIKTKFSIPDDSQYLESCQWRFYLELFGLDTFHFDLFIFEGYKIDKHGYDVRGLPLVRHAPPITCYRFDGMEHENHELLKRFLEWCEYRDYTKYLNYG